MSVRETSRGCGSVRRLRGRLTGPVDLPRGKSESADESGSTVEARTHSHEAFRDRRDAKDVLMPSHEGEICELVSKSAAEPRRDDGWGEEAAAVNTATAVGSLSLDQRELKGSQSHPNRVTRKLKALKRVFSPSVICLRCTRRAGGDHDEGEYPAVTLFNSQARDFVGRAAKSPSISFISTLEVKGPRSPRQDPAPQEKEDAKNKTFRLFKRLVGVPEPHPRTRFLGPYNPVQCEGAAHSSKRQPRLLWSRRPKKPSPFFQERIGDGQEYVEEETIILVNKHVDDHSARGMMPSPFLDKADGYQRPEMLTVSVDVSALTLEVKDGPEASRPPDSSGAPSRASKDVNVIAEPERRPDDGPIGRKEIQMIPNSSEDHSSPRSGTGSQRSDVRQSLGLPQGQRADNGPSVTSSGNHQPSPPAGEEIRRVATNSSESETVCQDAVAGCMPAAAAAEDDDFHLDKLENMKSCGFERTPAPKSGPCTSRPGRADSEDDTERWGDKKEILLLETARSVVQLAIKAALDQLKGELRDSVAHADRSDCR